MNAWEQFYIPIMGGFLMLVFQNLCMLFFTYYENYILNVENVSNTKMENLYFCIKIIYC